MNITANQNCIKCLRMYESDSLVCLKCSVNPVLRVNLFEQGSPNFEKLEQELGVEILSPDKLMKSSWSWDVEPVDSGNTQFIFALYTPDYVFREKSAVRLSYSEALSYFEDKYNL